MLNQGHLNNAKLIILLEYVKNGKIWLQTWLQLSPLKKQKKKKKMKTWLQLMATTLTKKINMTIILKI